MDSEIASAAAGAGQAPGWLASGGLWSTVGAYSEKLQPAVEDPAVYHLERNVGVPVDDPVLAGGAGDSRASPRRPRTRRRMMKSTIRFCIARSFRRTGFPT